MCLPRAGSPGRRICTELARGGTPSESRPEARARPPSASALDARLSRAIVRDGEEHRLQAEGPGPATPEQFRARWKTPPPTLTKTLEATGPARYKGLPGSDHSD